MSSAVMYLVPIALLAVAAVLVLGLWNMLRGDNANRSQKLMRWRVVLQLVAVILVMTAIYFTRG